jgi:PKD repeat protein
MDDELEFSAELQVDWGDGQLDDAPVYWDNPKGHCFAHAYSAPGTYRATITVVPGHETQSRQQVTITVAPPLAYVTAAGTCACHHAAVLHASGLPATVAVPGVASAPAPTFSWDFGDGATAVTTTSSTPHTFPAPGTYTVRVTATRPAFADLFRGYDRATAWSTATVTVGR